MKLCICFCHGLEICTWFGYNPWINFCHFVNFVIFWPQILWKCIDSGYLVSATPYTISCLSLCNFAHLFFHGLKMCMWFGFNPAVNFCHFSTLLTLSFFAGATSTSPKFDLYFWHEMLSKCIDSMYLVGASYSFTLNVLKLCRCFLNGMKMCMCFGYKPLIIFSDFFCFVKLVFFFGMKSIKVFFFGMKSIKVYRQWVPCGRNCFFTVFHQLFWNFADVFGMEWRCACGLGIILWLV